MREALLILALLVFGTPAAWGQDDSAAASLPPSMRAQLIDACDALTAATVRLKWEQQEVAALLAGDDAIIHSAANASVDDRHHQAARAVYAATAMVRAKEQVRLQRLADDQQEVRNQLETTAGHMPECYLPQD